MSTRKKLVRRHLAANRTLTAITLEFGRGGVAQQAGDGEGEDPCPCDGQATLIIEGEGPPACEWGSEECPRNTVEPPIDDDPPTTECPTDGVPVGVVARRGAKSLRIEFSAEKADLARRLIAELTED